MRIKKIHPAMDIREPGSFEGIPPELLLMVIEHCSPRGIAALSGVAKAYNICRPIIFRKIDLSIHNRGNVPCTFRRDDRCPPSTWDEPSDSLQCNNIPPNMQQRQEAFLSALIRNPSLAQHIETFSWTLLLLDSNRRTTLGTDPFAINESVALDPESPFNKIWNVFASLTRVRTLDLAWLSRHLAMPLIHSIPSTLFPAATSVRLVGVMPYALAASILLTNPQNLLHLDLDNLQQSGITPSAPIDKWSRDADADDEDSDVPKQRVRRRLRQINTQPARPNPSHCQTRQPWNNLAPFRNKGVYFNAPGPMQNLLGALAGKCTSIRSLHLRKAGARDQFDFPPACSSKETDIYAEWAVFLASVRATLETFTFEQGERLLPRVDRAQPPVRPMDRLFGESIFPVLKEAGAGLWPRVGKVVVRGVQQWEEDDGQGIGETVLVDGRGELGGAFGKGVEVVMKRRAREADHLGVGYG